VSAVSQCYDILIAGGGMVGAALACALGDSPLRVAVVESTPAAREFPPEHDRRVSAITLATRTLFENIGAWHAMQARRVHPLRAMHVWDSQGSGEIHFDAADLGEADLGYIIENRVVVAALHERLASCANVDLYCPARIELLRAADAGVAATLEDGSVLQARLLVGADGANSTIRAWAGIGSNGWSYRQTAIVATVATTHAHDASAWQVFLPTGPLAFLPLSDCLCSIVWSCDTPRADELLRLDDVTFLAELHAAFGDHLGDLVSVSQRAAYPLSLAHSAAYVRDGIVLVGDAAHRVHPLAGQGVNLGLMDAATLAEEVLAAASARRDLGALAVLRRYERRRKGDTLAMLAVTDAFKRGFGTRLAPVVQLRNLGMSVMDRLAPMKRLIVRRAVGLSGDLPALARGTRC
jgi:2-octaprenylphenol hydroxylase